MNDGLHWYQMFLMFGMLIALFCGPFAAIAVHDRIKRRRAMQQGTE